MLHVSDTEFNSKGFQKWWARHPLRAVSVNNSKPLLHKNALLCFCGMLIAVMIFGTAVEIDLCKWVIYKNQKSTLTEKQIQEQYSKFQIARYDTYSKLKEKMK